MTVAILDYDAGNITSVQRACAHVGIETTITADPDTIAAASHVIFPGVGAAGQCMGALQGRGLDAALRGAIDRQQPVLAICVGMQLLFDHSAEDGGVDCLGFLSGQVTKLRGTEDDGSKLPVPHMGWNPTRLAADPLFADIAADTPFYYVHSYHCVPAEGVQVIADCAYGQTVCAGVRLGSLAAVQFHPEKSGEPGLQLLRNFLNS